MLTVGFRRVRVLLPGPPGSAGNYLRLTSQYVALGGGSTIEFSMLR